MNLTIDIGNTQAKLVVFDGENPVEEQRTSNTSLEALSNIIAHYPIEKGIVSSVANLASPTEMLLSCLPFPVLRLTPTTPVPFIVNEYRTPSTLGADRLAAVVGAVVLQPGKDLLIIDAGTCITYDFLDSNGHYKGGNISPGLHMRLQAMHDQTARLPLVEAEGERPSIGYDTETAIRSGAIEGIKFEIEGYIRLYKKKFPSLLVFLTGGDHFDFDTPIKNTIFADNFLVARGLNRILAYNS